jgi:mycothiol synthase
MDLALRALTVDDTPAWARLLEEVEAADRTGEHFSVEDLAHELANPDIELGKDAVGCYDGATMVGYYKVIPRGESDGELKIIIDGAVLPERRGQGIGTWLMEPLLARAAEVHREKAPGVPAKLMLFGRADDAVQEDLVGSFGLRPGRWSFVMRVARADVVTTATLPDGYRIRTYEPSMSEALLAAHNEAFLDHPGFMPWTEVMWKQWLTDNPAFRPDVSFVVVSDGEPDRIAAYLTTDEYDGYRVATGRREAWVARLGTLRRHRGKGVAGAMLQHALAVFREQGFDESSLMVDSANPTGALGVYERAGYTVETRFTEYSRIIPAP